MSRRLNFIQAIQMQLPHVPRVGELESAWVTYSNANFDPVAGRADLTRQLALVETAEQLGFDGVAFNEHHQTPCGVPDVNITAAHAVARTRHLAICLLGNTIPLHGNPLRVAESVAMLDVLSGGRIVSGFVRGQGMEYHSLRGNPATSRSRFWEAHDLIVRAWTEPGPFEWIGRHFDIPYVNPWPVPYQRPHPPIWLPGQGSRETIREAARRRYPFLMVFAPVAFTKVNYDMYREAAGEFGYEPTSEQLAFTAFVHVAETDEQARREIRPHIDELMPLYRFPAPYFTPPGYFSGRSLGAMVRGSEKFGIRPPGQMHFDDMVRQQVLLVGSPETIVEKLSQYSDELGAGTFQFVVPATAPPWLALQTMTLMAEQVMPHFRPAGNEPFWRRGLPLPGMQALLDGRSAQDAEPRGANPALTA
jgi:alkanesulfonate monooxygenase SsuD/methylene tetrahydromethanopterin reductase-like flavin-dependent oxidoreductase (luciferase family)